MDCSFYWNPINPLFKLFNYSVEHFLFFQRVIRKIVNHFKINIVVFKEGPNSLQFIGSTRNFDSCHT